MITMDKASPGFQLLSDKPGAIGYRPQFRYRDTERNPRGYRPHRIPLWWRFLDRLGQLV